jgi:hypothetical protein
MAEARKVFPMNTFVSYLKGVDKEANKKGVVELVGYMTQTEIDEELAPFAAPWPRPGSTSSTPSW